MSKNNEIIVFKRQASVDFENLPKVLNEKLADLMRYDFTMPIERHEDNVAIKKIIANANKNWKPIQTELSAFRQESLKLYDEVKKIIDATKIDYDNKLNEAKKASSEYENKELDKKIERVRDYFNEHNKQNFLVFEHLNIKILYGTVESSLYKEIDEKLKQLEMDLTLIENMDNKERILVEYEKEPLNLSQALSNVNEQIAQEEAVIKRMNEANKVVEPVIVEKEQEKAVIEKTTVEVNKYHIKLECTHEQMHDIEMYLKQKGIKFRATKELS